MSYSRWSTNDFQCDVYVYANVNGCWTIHVAGNRIVYKAPLPDPVPFDRDHSVEWFDRYRQVMAMVDNAERAPIDLPHAGDSFDEPTPGACADRLAELKKLGYNMPDDVIPALRQEQEELDGHQARN